MTRHFGKALSFLLLSAFIFIAGCNDSDPVPANENELITTLKLTFRMREHDGTPVDADPVTFTWRDADGPGPGAPMADEIHLEANATYALELQVLDESKNPVEDISAEIREEDEEHQFFFVISGVDAAVVYDDEDGNGNPVGLTSVVETGAAGAGSLNVILRHELNKSGAGVRSGNPANAGGETDLDVTFDVTIQ